MEDELRDRTTDAIAKMLLQLPPSYFMQVMIKVGKRMDAIGEKAKKDAAKSSY